MRIIAGTARGKRLTTLDGADTRPTLERVKEAMFSAVQMYLPGAVVLDLFAGSGQLGLEALSRGAAFCIFVENNRNAAKVVVENIRNCGLQLKSSLVQQEAASFLVAAAARPETDTHSRFDLVLLDPPYGSGLLPDLLEKAAAVCRPGAYILCETAAGTPMPEQVAGLALKKQYRHGTVLVSRYQMEENGPA